MAHREGHYLSISQWIFLIGSTRFRRGFNALLECEILLHLDLPSILRIR